MQTPELFSNNGRLTTDTGTNTGMSLLLAQVPQEISIPGEASVSVSVPGDVTIRTETSIPQFGSIHLDLHSFGSRLKLITQ